MTVNQKLEWMLGHGFTRKWCEWRRVMTYEYAGYSFTKEELGASSLYNLINYKKFYDGFISEKQLIHLEKLEQRYHERKHQQNQKEAIPC